MKVWSMKGGLRPMAFAAVLVLAACQTGSPTAEGNTSVSQSDAFLLDLRIIGARRVGALPSSPASFLTGDDEVRASLRELPEDRCRQVGPWLTCFATRTGTSLGVALRDDGTRCFHRGDVRRGFLTEVADTATAASLRSVAGGVTTWTELARTCEALA